MFLPGYAIQRDDYTSNSIYVDHQTATNGTGPKTLGKYMKATGSCCLVASGTNYVLFDTLGPWEKDLLVDKLESHKIHPDDINYVVCSHSHPDHIGNLNLFTKAKKHFVGTSVYTNDLYDLNCFEPIGSYKYKQPPKESWLEPTPEIDVIVHKPFDLDSNLRLIPTPGHTMECISMLVNNCQDFGKVGLVGDLFENKDDVANEGIWLAAGSQNPDLQRAHRARLYEDCDYIFPGHGDFFQTTPGLKL